MASFIICTIQLIGQFDSCYVVMEIYIAKYRSVMAQTSFHINWPTGEEGSNIHNQPWITDDEEVKKFSEFVCTLLTQAGQKVCWVIKCEYYTQGKCQKVFFNANHSSLYLSVNPLKVGRPF